MSIRRRLQKRGYAKSLREIGGNYLQPFCSSLSLNVSDQQSGEHTAMPDYLTRSDAADYLSGRLGRRISVGALEQHAYNGTGPRYAMVLARASYRRDDLDQWVEGLAQAPQKRRKAAPRPTSGSDLDAPVAA